MKWHYCYCIYDVYTNDNTTCTSCVGLAVAFLFHQTLRTLLHWHGKHPRGRFPKLPDNMLSTRAANSQGLWTDLSVFARQHAVVLTTK